MIAIWGLLDINTQMLPGAKGRQQHLSEII